jgi:hypothetical protein
MDTIKTTIITMLVVVGILWLVRESTDDPDYIVLEYQCSKLGTYEHVPTEVTEECNNRKAK